MVCRLIGVCNLQVPDDGFAALLSRFSNEAKLEGTFFFCRQDGIMQIAKLLEKIDNLSLEDRYAYRYSMHVKYCSQHPFGSAEFFVGVLLWFM